MQQILKWPIREGLLAFVEVLKQDAAEEFRFAKLAYAIGGGRKPEVPKILKGS